MYYKIIRTLFGRWKVYALGHPDGDKMWLATFRSKMWLATFRSKHAAEAWVNGKSPRS